MYACGVIALLLAFSAATLNWILCMYSLAWPRVLMLLRFSRIAIFPSSVLPVSSYSVLAIMCRKPHTFPDSGNGCAISAACSSAERGFLLAFMLKAGPFNFFGKSVLGAAAAAVRCVKSLAFPSRCVNDPTPNMFSRVFSTEV